MAYGIYDGHKATLSLYKDPPRIDGVYTRRTGLVTPPALGRPKAAVIGTGRVDGIPVYGQAKVVTTTYQGTRIGSQFNLTYPDPTSVATIDVVYLLAKDYFGRGYDIIRIEADGQVVFDAENGAIPSIQFRFYNGLQTAVDPVVKQIVGANAGAHTGDVLLVLPDYPAAQAPTITAVISNAASQTGGTKQLTWVGQAPTSPGTNTFRFAGYDPVDGILYQILTNAEIPSLTVCYLVALDVDTGVEQYRVPLEGSEIYVDANPYLAVLRGSGYVVVFARLDIAPTGVLPTRVYNATTGSIVAEFIENSDERFVWFASVKFGDQFLLAGTDIYDTAYDPTAFAVIDLTAGSFSVTRNSVSVGEIPMVAGRVAADSASFFMYDGNLVYEVTYGGDGWSTATVFDPDGQITGMHYDPLTEYLVVLETFPAGTYNVRLITPTTGAIVETFTVSLLLDYISGPLWTERAFPRPGYALFDHNHQEIWSIDINAKTATKLDEHATGVVFVDQARLAYFMYSSTNKIWTEYTIPGSTPGEITTQSHVTDLLTHLGPYTVDQIRFEGFNALFDWGDVIDKDTSILTVLRTYQDPLGFVWSDIGDEIVFRKTPTDGSFVADESLADTDIVFKSNGSIRSDDESDLTRVAKVTFEYVSKENNYQARTVTADEYSALYEVTRSTKEMNFSTSMVLSDADGEQYVQELLLRQQAKERTHSFSTFSDFAHLIPGDVISVPSGNIDYTVEISKVNIKENLVIDFEARDFQTSLAADVAVVSNTGYSGITSVTLQSQYIHLDIPLLRLGDDAAGAALVQYGMVAGRGQPNWGGGTLYRGDTASTFAVMYDQAPHTAFVGICKTVLPDNPNPHSGDFSSSIIVQRISGAAPTSAAESAVMLGTNLAFVGREGRWEGLGFTTVVDNGDGTFTISGFPVRGWRGTEVYGPQHQIGDLFVLVRQDWVRKLPHPPSDLDLTKYYKAVGFGGSIAAAVAEAHQIAGAAERPYAVVNLCGQLSGGDTIVDFDYRNRLSAWEMFNAVPSCGEATLAFEMDVLDADSPTGVLRTISVGTNQFTYTAAQKSADWGSPPPSAQARVYMMSATVGRGHVAEVTIPL
ncbi:hypothetical protein MPL3356_60473 [Mesorhizobium plurifarium]|uniref:Uncharacterized protein n=1 Tax=Mesorhizobium plurifarium TaxID=69974 RepID=A0A090EFB7_MESPL|nr:hypothetical protein MPL3356_60473 [Mesorhizobium plurifarium]